MCTSPSRAWLPNQPDADGKKPLLFRPPNHIKIHHYSRIQTPCGNCIACEQLRALRTAMQLVCELHTTEGESWFLTLTLNDENLSADFSVHKKHLQKFFHDLRYWRKTQKQQDKFRYLSQGEYGGQFGRPHYHLAAFNLILPDLEKTTSSGKYDAFTSEIINKIWGKGDVHLIRLSFENCLYIAQHHLDDKVDNKTPVHKIPILHPLTGKIIRERHSEFSTRSSRPGLGKQFFEKYFEEIYTSDSTINKGQEMPVPKYFDSLLKVQNPELYEHIKEQRALNIKARTPTQNRYQDKFNRAKLKSKK